MKPTVSAALAFAAIIASGQALACDDMRAGDYGDGGYQASKAPETTAPVADKNAAPLTVTSKKAPVKKTAGKPLPQGGVAVARTN